MKSIIIKISEVEAVMLKELQHHKKDYKDFNGVIRSLIRRDYEQLKKK